jgi:hypothetical protein
MGTWQLPWVLVQTKKRVRTTRNASLHGHTLEQHKIQNSNAKKRDNGATNIRTKENSLKIQSTQPR